MPVPAFKWVETAGKIFAKSMEILCAAWFGLLFLVFIAQIFYRYVLNEPLAWTQEIAAILFVWIVCLGSATIVKERDHVTFSLIYASVRPRVRRVLALIGTGFLTLIMIVTLYGNLDYIAFTFRQKTPTLRLPMSVIFSAFGVFMVLIIINGLIRIYRLSRDGWEQER